MSELSFFTVYFSKETVVVLGARVLCHAVPWLVVKDPDLMGTRGLSSFVLSSLTFLDSCLGSV